MKSTLIHWKNNISKIASSIIDPIRWNSHEKYQFIKIYFFYSIQSLGTNDLIMFENTNSWNLSLIISHYCINEKIFDALMSKSDLIYNVINGKYWDHMAIDDYWILCAK